MTSGLAKEGEMVTILTIRRMLSPWESRKFAGVDNFPEDWEMFLCPVAASQSHATWEITCDGDPHVSLR